jgi:hypothetical protein
MVYYPISAPFKTVNKEQNVKFKFPNEMKRNRVFYLQREHLRREGREGRGCCWWCFAVSVKTEI